MESFQKQPLQQQTAENKNQHSTFLSFSMKCSCVLRREEDSSYVTIILERLLLDWRNYYFFFFPFRRCFIYWIRFVFVRFKRCPAGGHVTGWSPERVALRLRVTNTQTGSPPGHLRRLKAEAERWLEPPLNLFKSATSLTGLHLRW